MIGGASFGLLAALHLCVVGLNLFTVGHCDHDRLIASFTNHAGSCETAGHRGRIVLVKLQMHARPLKLIAQDALDRSLVANEGLTQELRVGAGRVQLRHECGVRERLASDMLSRSEAAATRTCSRLLTLHWPLNFGWPNLMVLIYLVNDAAPRMHAKADRRRLQRQQALVLLSPSDPVEVLSGDLRYDTALEAAVLRRANVPLQWFNSLLNQQASLRLAQRAHCLIGAHAGSWIMLVTRACRGRLTASGPSGTRAHLQLLKASAIGVNLWRERVVHSY